MNDMTAQRARSTLGRIFAHPLVVAIPLLLLFTAGCGSEEQDVTNDPAFGNFASVVGTWKTKVPLRLVEIEKKLYGTKRSPVPICCCCQREPKSALSVWSLDPRLKRIS